jgi:hypothetical protein
VLPNVVVITNLLRVVFFAVRPSRRRHHQLGGREGLHLREGREHLELLMVLVMVFLLLLSETEPTQERSVPATEPLEEQAWSS